MIKKSVAGGIILLFLLVSIFPMVSSISSSYNNIIYVDNDGGAYYTKIHYKIENGSLSGFVNDSFFNPIEGALVSIKCGGLHMQNISDSTGFYYIDNVPIVDCYWNISASKHGYDTFWVEMSIDINSTYDFILIPSDTILYVGGNGPNNYSKIQDAIGYANDGDTIFVYEGNYYENLIVDKSINLTGAERNTTMIHGKNNSKDYSSIIKIKDDNVTVSEFTLSTERNLRGIFIEGSDSHLLTNIRIFNNTIIRPEYGDSICIFYARNIYISSNILYGVFGAGYCINVTVYSNEIHGYGIECVMALSIHFIKNNLFLDFPSYPMVKYLIFQPWEVIKYPWYLDFVTLAKVNRHLLNIAVAISKINSTLTASIILFFK
jgi:hypothetical protein